MKVLWIFAAAIFALTPAHADEKEEESWAGVNGLRICEVPPPPDSVIKLLPELTDEPSHRFFSAEI